MATLTFGLRGSPRGLPPPQLRLRERSGPRSAVKLLGYEVVRFTWRQLTDDPAAVAATLRELLRK